MNQSNNQTINELIDQSMESSNPATKYWQFSAKCRNVQDSCFYTVNKLEVVQLTNTRFHMNKLKTNMDDIEAVIISSEEKKSAI